MALITHKAVTFKGAHLIVHANGMVQDSTGRTLSPSKDGNGYWRIYVKNGSGKTLTLHIHTLIAAVYLGYKYRRDYVIFKDGDKRNWALRNLEVRTRLQHRRLLKENK